MKIEFICPVCGEKSAIEIPEMELDYCVPDEPAYCEIWTKFNCPECEKQYTISG